MGGAVSVESRMSEQQKSCLSNSFMKRLEEEASTIDLLDASSSTGKTVEMHIKVEQMYEKLVHEYIAREAARAKCAATEAKRIAREKLAAATALALASKSSWNTDPEAMEKLEKKRTLTDHFNAVAREKFSLPPSSDHSRSMSMSSIACSDDSSLSDYPPQDSWSESNPDCKAYVCNLCNKAFPSKWQLDKHLLHSLVHSRNMEERERQFDVAFKKAGKIAEILKQSISRFSQGASSSLAPAVVKKTTKASASAAVPETEPTISAASIRARIRWRSAFDKVLKRLAWQNFTMFVQENDVKQHDTHESILLYEGRKHFWKQGEKVGIHCFHHPKTNTIEIAPQIFANFSAGGVVPFDPSYCDRLYLCYSVLLKNVEEKARANIDDYSWHRCGRGKFAATKPSFETMQDIEKKTLVDYVLEGLVLTRIERKSSKSVPKKGFVDEEEEDAKFTLSWELPMNPPPLGGEVGEFSDISPSSRRAQWGSALCMMPCRPSGLVCTPVTTVKFFKDWEIDSKILHVAEATGVMNQAVMKAHKTASLLQESVDNFLSLSSLLLSSSVNTRDNSSCARYRSARNPIHEKFLRVSRRIIRQYQVSKTTDRLEALEQVVEVDEKLEAEGEEQFLEDEEKKDDIEQTQTISHSGGSYHKPTASAYARLK